MINVTGIAVKADAIQSLKPKAEWALNGDVLTWMDDEIKGRHPK